MVRTVVRRKNSRKSGHNMELIAEITDKSLGFATVKTVKYRLKKSVRIIIIDQKGRIVLVYWRQPNTYILPGGRPDAGERLAKCAKREALEETGYTIDIDRVVGAIIAIKSRTGLRQVSYCFLSHTIGPQQPLKLTPAEKMEGISVRYAKDIKEAIRLIKSGSKTYDNKFRSERDVLFLQKGIA